MNRKKDIVQLINKLSGSQSPYDVFYAWVKCMALALQNTTDLFHQNGEVWKAREKDYIQTITLHKEYGTAFPQMYQFLIETMESETTDILGEIYMGSGCGNKNTGQFFTPFNICLMMAEMNMEQQIGKETIRVYEPSCGGGGMLLAAAAVLKKRGINYQRVLDIVAQDLDWKAVYMTYVQLSLYGIKAIVVQGNTLMEPYTGQNYPPERVFITPAKGGVLVG